MGGQGRVFISYSHQDESWKDRLVRHLRVLERQGLLDVWDDRRIAAGDDWQAEIEEADVAVLLVSADFLGSDFIVDEEVPRLLERRVSEGLRVIPVILRPCTWQAVDWLAGIQARPRDGHPLSDGDENRIDADLAALALEIRELSTDGPVDAASAETPDDLRLRAWDPPPYPPKPYPLLLPYSHPELLAGRELELAELRGELEQPIPILGLYAPSGAGKSSLLNAGLVPALRAENVPVAFDRYPRESGLGGRLISQLLTGPDGSRPRLDGDPAHFVGHLAALRRLAGQPALLVLDQFEDVLGPGETQKAARAEVGPLLAATVGEQLAGEEPLCRWLLAHRRDFHGALKDWLKDVLSDARRAGRDVVGLPFELLKPARFQAWSLPLLGASPPGDDSLDEPLRAFRSAIETPLGLLTDDGAPRYAVRFDGDGAERLARAFAEARLEQPEAPLTPELQVVLAHLTKGTGAAIVVPDDPEHLIADALDAHLASALRTAFPAGSESAVRRGRTRALLALRELAGAQGRAEVGLPASRLAQAIGQDGDTILEELAKEDARLIVAREDFEDASGKRYVLSHDRLAEAVLRAVEEEGAKLDVDRELLRLRKVVALNAELFQEVEARQATDLGLRQFLQVRENAEVLLWDEERKAWWAECERRASLPEYQELLHLNEVVTSGVERSSSEQGESGRLTRQDFQRVAEKAEDLLWDRERKQWWRECRRLRRARRRRGLVSAGLVLLLLTLAGFQLWSRWQETVRRNAQAFATLADLSAEDRDLPGAREWLSKAPLQSLLKVFETIPADMELGVLQRTRLDAVRFMLPSLRDGDPDDLRLVGLLAWVLDDVAARNHVLTEEARALRAKVLAPFDPPPPPSADDDTWVRIRGGEFMMGSAEEEGSDDERPAHKVKISPFRMLVHELTLGEFRRLFPGHGDGPEDHPAVNVDWYQAYAYAAWLGGRLPTEAEWEYAARANCKSEPCGPDGEKVSLDEVAWYGENSGFEIHPVCGKKRNPWGLCDILGNAWEWTADWYGPYSADPAVDPRGPPGGGGRVIRGGSVRITADGARSAFRNRLHPEVVSWDRGFRVVLPGP